LLARRLPRDAWFIAWMAGLAWAVSLGVELIYIRDHLDGGQAERMNTVFKFGLQSWILMAVAAAAALPWLARGLRRAGAAAQTVGWACIAALVGLALVFPLAGIPSRVAYRFPETSGVTLDGLAFMDHATYNWNGFDISLRADAEAIRWLDANIHGTPIVLQSSMEFYRAYGVRIAANTGLPTIVSPLHASEQQDPEQVAARDRDVQEIYSTLDSARALELLAKYHVGYVYAGPIERRAYGDAGMAKFNQLLGSYLTVAYQNAEVKIYKVSPSTYGFATSADLPPPPEPQPRPSDQSAPDNQQAAAQPTDDQSTIEALEQQVAADPSAAGPAFSLAQRYRELKRLDDAAAVLEPAARANPNDVGLHHLWGDILRDAGRIDEAEAAYRDAIAAAPNAGNYNKLGVELAKWGKFDQAIEAFKQAIAADANASEPYFHLGEVYEQQGKPDQAAEQYRAYLTIATTSDQFYNDATAALERLKK
jgi:tetratricopeptide (TPR) repeat protein